MLYKNGKLSSFLKVITIQWNPWGYSHFHYFLSKKRILSSCSICHFFNNTLDFPLSFC